MEICLQDVNAEVLETFLGVVTTHRCGHPFLRWLGSELRAELTRRKRGGEPVVLRIPDLPLGELGAGVTIAETIAARFAQHATHPRSRHLWRTLSTDYEIEDSAGLLLLETVVHSFDRALAARKVLKAEGPLVRDRFRQLKVHPACLIENNARLVMMKALKELHLDLEPLGPVGRPPGR
jgi:hypothetical protein